MARKQSQNTLARLRREAAKERLHAQAANHEDAICLEIRPNDGIGPIKLGMDRDTVRKIMGSSRRSETDMDHFDALKVCYGPDQKVEFVEASTGSDTVFLFEGMDVFDTPEDTLVRHVKRFDTPDPQLSKKGAEYLFPKLILSLWSPEGQYDHRRNEDRPIFGTVGIGNADYLAAIREIKGPKDALDVDWPAENKPKRKYQSAVNALRKLGDADGFSPVDIGIDDTGDVRLVRFSAGWGRRITLTEEQMGILKSFPRLEGMSVVLTTVSDKLLIHLRDMTSLKALNLDTDNITDKCLAPVTSLQTLDSLYLPDTISAHGLKQLTKLKKLRRLSLSLSQAAQPGLKHLQGMTNLRALNLSEHVTKQAWQIVGTLANLEELDLPITDAGMKYLTNLTKLRKLSIDTKTHITDAAIVHLEKLSRLEKLSAWFSRLSDKGITRLRRSLPRLKVYQ